MSDFDARVDVALNALRSAINTFGSTECTGFIKSSLLTVKELHTSNTCSNLVKGSAVEIVQYSFESAYRGGLTDGRPFHPCPQCGSVVQKAAETFTIFLQSIQDAVRAAAPDPVNSDFYLFNAAACLEQVLYKTPPFFDNNPLLVSTILKALADVVAALFALAKSKLQNPTPFTEDTVHGAFHGEAIPKAYIVSGLEKHAENFTGKTTLDKFLSVIPYTERVGNGFWYFKAPKFLAEELRASPSTYLFPGSVSSTTLWDTAHALRADGVSAKEALACAYALH